MKLFELYRVQYVFWYGLMLEWWYHSLTDPKFNPMLNYLKEKER